MADSQDSAIDLKLGTRVRSADGEFLGEVKEIQSDHYVIEKGRIFQDDFFIPKTAMENYDGESAAVNLTFDDIHHAGWDEPPLYNDLDDLAFKDSGDNPVTPDLLGVIAPPMSGDFDEEPAFDPEANIVTIAKGDFPIEIDMHVHSVDDHDLGKVVTVSPHHVMIEKGHLFKEDFSVPKSAVREVRDGKVYLNVTKEAVHRAGWENEPESEVLRRPEMPLDPSEHY
jgi:hypothetical protein